MFTPEQNHALDAILEARRSCRGFTNQVPGKEDIQAIIHAGDLAPFASISVSDVEIFRHYYVLFQDNPLFPVIDALIRRQSQADLDELLAKKASDPILTQFSKGLEAKWSGVARGGVPAFPNPPCLIIMAEWRGARRADSQSLTHAIQNMWLKATALGLDFGILSIIESMCHNQEFCDLFGLPVGEYGFHGCVVGYRKTLDLPARTIPSAAHWL